MAPPRPTRTAIVHAGGRRTPSLAKAACRLQPAKLERRPRDTHARPLQRTLIKAKFRPRKTQKARRKTEALWPPWKRCPFRVFRGLDQQILHSSVAEVVSHSIPLPPLWICALVLHSITGSKQKPYFNHFLTNFHLRNSLAHRNRAPRTAETFCNFSLLETKNQRLLKKSY